MLFTKQQLIDKATAKGLDIEYSSIEHGHQLIGIRFKKKFVWHWFISFGDKNTETFFDHSYSMNTGVSKKGYKHGQKIIKFIFK